MKNRCVNSNNTRFKDYGGRGITICDKWLDFNGFKEDMFDAYKQGLSIDRIDNSDGYYKENCRWATRKEQASNTRNIDLAQKYTYMGIENTINYWAQRFGISRETLSKRLLKLGWDFERAILTPVNYSNKPINYKIKRDKFGRFLKSN